MPEFPLEELLKGSANAKARARGIFRWRGRLNWKDIVERIIAGVIAGGAAGSTFFILDKIF